MTLGAFAEKRIPRHKLQVNSRPGGLVYVSCFQGQISNVAEEVLAVGLVLLLDP